MKILQKILSFIVFVFTALLPLKFTHMAGVPEIPPSWHFDFLSLLFSVYSPFLFTFFSGSLLFLLLGETLISRRPFRFRGGALLWILWSLTLLAGAAGIRNASCADASRQIMAYLAGLSGFTGCVFLFLNTGKNAARVLCGALLTGSVLAAFSVLYQYFSGLDELRGYVADQGLAPALSPSMLRQLASDRLFGSFPLSNTCGGYLAAFLIPAVLLAWHWAGKHVTPERPAQFLAAVFVFLFFGFPLWRTGSRGALLALFAGLLIVCVPPLIVRGWFRGWRSFLSLGAIILLLSGFLLIVKSGRGFGSMFYRLDYDFAALKMMLEHPFCGTGWGDFFHDYPHLKELCNNEYPHSPHNLLLFFGAQCGIAGFLAALALLFFPLFTGVKTLFRRLNGVSPENGENDCAIFRLCAVLSLLTVLSADSLVEVGIESPAFAAALATAGFLVLHESGSGAAGKETILPAGPVSQLLLCVLLFLTALAATVLSVPVIRGEAAYARLYETVNPRFSSSGADAGTLDPELVEAEFRIASAGVPGNPFVFWTAAGFYASRGDFVRAESLISEAVLLSPEESGFYKGRALCRVRRLGGVADSAVRADLEMMLRLSPCDPERKRFVSGIVSPSVPAGIPAEFPPRAEGCP